MIVTRVPWVPEVGVLPQIEGVTLVVILPIALVSVNHRAPSGPLAQIVQEIGPG